MFSWKLVCTKIHDGQFAKVVLLAWRMVARVWYDPDDRDGHAGLIRFADCHRIVDLFADRILPREKSLRRQFIDNCHARLVGDVLGGESSSAHDRHLEHAKIIWRNDVHLADRFLSRWIGRRPSDMKGTVPFVAVEGRVTAIRHGADSGQHS